jgi:hypothetical protein
VGRATREDLKKGNEEKIQNKESNVSLKKKIYEKRVTIEE